MPQTQTDTPAKVIVVPCFGCGAGLPLRLKAVDGKQPMRARILLAVYEADCACGLGATLIFGRGPK